MQRWSTFGANECHREDFEIIENDKIRGMFNKGLLQLRRGGNLGNARKKTFFFIRDVPLLVLRRNANIFKYKDDEDLIGKEGILYLFCRPPIHI